MHRISLFILSSISLFIGYSIYLGWRDKSPLIGLVDLEWQLRNQLRFNIIDFVHLPEWAVYSLPQGLWAFGFSLSMGAIWCVQNQKLRYLWLAASFFIVIFWEILQKYEVISGTFCWIDMIMGICGFGLGIVLLELKNK